MEKSFSNKWKSSAQPRKQRKYQYNAPLHLRGKFLHAHLSKELRTKYKCRSVRIRRGDKVKVLRGRFKGQTGKVDRVNLGRGSLFIQKMEVIKKDGTKRTVGINPSNVLIQDLDLSDKRRVASLERGIKNG